MNRDPLIFVHLDEGNFDTLTEGMSVLHKEVSGEWHSPAYWRWLYLDNPVGGSKTILALRNNRVVGKFSHVYMRLSVGQKHMIAGLTGDLQVLSCDRSWAAYRGLIDSCIGMGESERSSFGYGFASHKAAQLSQRVGGIILGRMPVYGGFLNVARILEGRSVPHLLSLCGWIAQPFFKLRIHTLKRFDFEIQKVDEFDNSFDELWEDIEKNRSIAIVRNSTYLNWRYVKCPDQFYTKLVAFREGRPEGLIVLRQNSKKQIAYIVEMMARRDNQDALRSMLAYALELLAKERIGLVVASFQASSMEATVLADAGFQHWLDRLWNVQMVLSISPLRVSEGERQMGNWYLSLGDWLSH